jgi:hypothetical protein
LPTVDTDFPKIDTPKFSFLKNPPAHDCSQNHLPSASSRSLKSRSPESFSSRNTPEENEESEENEENPIPQKAKNLSLFHLEKEKSLTFVPV